QYLTTEVNSFFTFQALESNSLLSLSWSKLPDSKLLQSPAQNRARNRTLIFQKSLAIDRHIGPRRDVHLAHRTNHMTHRKAHHAGIASAHLGNRVKVWMLDRVCASLIQRVASLDVGTDLLV